jgi:outer membrane protein assembly factor BamB
MYSRTFYISTVSFALAYLGRPLPATADSWIDAPSLSGFDRPGLSTDAPLRPGKLLPGGPVRRSSPVIADLDGDLKNGMEIVAAGADGLIHAYRSNGTHMWTAKTANHSCGGSGDRINSSPAVGDLRGTGKKQVVIGYGGFESECKGGVAAFEGKTGRKIWDFNLAQWAKQANFSERLYSVFSTPALSDVDRDGKLEIAFGGFDRRVYLLNSDGTTRWFLLAGDTVFSSPSFTDINRDGTQEVIATTDISENKVIRPPTQNGGLLYALDSQQKQNPLVPFQFRSNRVVKWLTPFDQVLQGSPSIADVTPRFRGVEIVQGTGCFFPEGSSNKRGKWLTVASPRTGKVLHRFKVPTCFSSTPAVGDLNEDGYKDVVITVNGDKSFGGDGKSKLVAFDIKRRRRMWVRNLEEPASHNPFAGFFMSPVIADVDGNGSLEVLASNSRTVGVYEGKTGRILTCADKTCSNGNPNILTTRFGGEAILTGPAVGDVDGDGSLEVVVGTNGGGIAKNQGALYVWTNLAGLINSAPGKHRPYSAPWPQFKGGEHRRGY